MTATDAVVIGGGIVGTAIAYYLTLRGWAVTLVEQHDLASGTSGACGGSVTMQTKRAGPIFACALQSQEMYRGLGHELGHDLEFRQHGSLVVAEDEAELEYVAALAAARRAAGLEIEWLDGPAAREWGAGLGPSVRAATFCATDAEVNPLKVTFAFAEAARRRGARIRTYTRVTGIRIEKGRVAGVRTDCGDLAAPTVVNAAGVWSPGIGRMAGIQVPIRPRRGVVLVTEVAPFRVCETLYSARYLTSKSHHADGHTSASNDAGFTGGLVLSATASGNLLVGSSRELTGYDVATPVEAITFIAREAVRILPIMSSVRMIRAYAGLRPLSPDGLPIIGHAPHLPGLVLATGHEGDGVALAPWTGRVVAELIETREPSEQLAPFGPQRVCPGC